MRRDIEFKSKGVTCRGWFYTPEKRKGPFPVVVMAGGWCYVKEIVMPHYAAFFERAGLAVLLFDYRNFGISDGEPRQHVDPHMQHEDYKNGISFVQSLPEVDPERVGIWGISYSGGHVLILGATDSRVKCIVSTIPLVDGYMNMVRAHGTMGFQRLQAAIMEDRKKRFETGQPGYMPMTAVDFHKTVCTYPYPETNKVFLEIKKKEAPLHEHRNTIESVELMMSYNVLPYAHRILNTPTLMILAEGDDLTPWDLAIQVFREIGAPNKKLFIQPKATHMALYSSKIKLEVAAEMAMNWFVEHLIKPYE